MRPVHVAVRNGMAHAKRARRIEGRALEAAHARQDAGGLHSKIIVMENSCAHIAVRKGTAHAKSARRVEGCVSKPVNAWT